MMSRLSIEFNCKIEVDGNACCEVLEELRDSSAFNRYLNRRDKNPPPYEDCEEDTWYEEDDVDGEYEDEIEYVEEEYEEPESDIYTDEFLEGLFDDDDDDEYGMGEYDINDPIYDGSKESIRKLKDRWAQYGW